MYVGFHDDDILVDRSDDMFAYMTINTVRDPKFSEGAELKITANKTILRYMEDAVLSMPTHFKRYIVHSNFNISNIFETMD